jgi:5'-nucleotidase
MKILITNDDGIESIGLKILWEALKEIAEVSIIAPDRQQSGKGISISFMAHIQVESVDSFPETLAWKVGGTPADCVKLGISALLDATPDFIVSGINHGSNAGRNILYSGTAGGAIEGVLRGIPSLAFSFALEEITPLFHTDKTFAIKRSIQHIIDHLTKHPLPPGTFLNVNFPHVSEEKIKGYKMTRQGKSLLLEILQKEITQEGHTQFFMDGENTRNEEEEESDTFLLEQGYITAVPIHVNEMTDRSHLKEKKEIFESSLNQIILEEKFKQL